MLAQEAITVGQGQPCQKACARGRCAITAALVFYLATQSCGLDLRWVDDESWYLLPASSLVREGRLRINVFDMSDRDFWPAPPLLSVLEAVSWLCHDLTVVQARLLTVGFGAVAVMGAFLLARRLFDDHVASMVAFIMATDNMVFLSGRTVRPEILVCAFGVLGLWLLLKALQDGTDWPAAVAGIATAAAATSHPNGVIVGLCGVALLTFTQGFSVLRKSSVYVYGGAWCAGMLPWLSFFVSQDAKHGYAGLRSLLALHAGGGTTTLDRLATSMTGELDRFVAFMALPYRAHIGALVLAALAWGVLSKDRRLKWCASCVLIYLLFFVFAVKANKSPRYLTLVVPFVAIIWAQALWLIWQVPVQASNYFRRMSACLLALVLVATQLVGNAMFLWKFRDADYVKVCRQLDALMPPESIAYGGLAFWMGLRDHHFVPYMRMPWRRAMEEFNPSVVILDDWVMVNGAYPGQWDELRKELCSYVREHGRLLGTVSNAFYGDLKVYEVHHLKPSSGEVIDDAAVP